MSLTFDRKLLKDLKAEERKWLDKLEETLASLPERLDRFSTVTSRCPIFIFVHILTKGLEPLSHPHCWQKKNLEAAYLNLSLRLIPGSLYPTLSGLDSRLRKMALL